MRYFRQEGNGGAGVISGKDRGWTNAERRSEGFSSPNSAIAYDFFKVNLTVTLTSCQSVFFGRFVSFSTAYVIALLCPSVIFSLTHFILYSHKVFCKTFNLHKASCSPCFFGLFAGVFLEVKLCNISEKYKGNRSEYPQEPHQKMHWTWRLYSKHSRIHWWMSVQNSLDTHHW